MSSFNRQDGLTLFSLVSDLIWVISTLLRGCSDPTTGATCSWPGRQFLVLPFYWIYVLEDLSSNAVIGLLSGMGTSVYLRL